MTDKETKTSKAKKFERAMFAVGLIVTINSMSALAVFIAFKLMGMGE